MLRFVGLLTCAFRGGDPCDHILAFPEKLQWPVFTEKMDLGAYSGGTVRDFHPVILFSIPGFDAGYATKWVLCYCLLGLYPPQEEVSRGNSSEINATRLQITVSLRGAKRRGNLLRNRRIIRNVA